MKAIVAISTSAGPEILAVNVDHYDPFAVLTVRDRTIQLTRDECRRIADALRAASLREPYEAMLDQHD